MCSLPAMSVPSSIEKHTARGKISTCTVFCRTRGAKPPARQELVLDTNLPSKKRGKTERQEAECRMVSGFVVQLSQTVLRFRTAALRHSRGKRPSAGRDKSKHRVRKGQLRRALQLLRSHGVSCSCAACEMRIVPEASADLACLAGTAR